ncbi:MAG: DUF6503 family protein [Algoriphagus sp.]|nr:DUF6503 family protein [Algoriphagus sp.]
MKYLARVSVLIVLLIFGFGCTKTPEKQAHEILEKSMKAHGGSEKWDKVSSLKFRKWTRLLTDSGTVESELDQILEFRMKPYFEGKITWTKDSVEHVSTWDGSRLRYTMGGNEIQNPGFLQSKKSDFDAAFYAVAQPWKLLDEGTRLSYEGQKNLENGQLAEVVRVDYGPESDVWWYYFDPVTFQLIGNEVQLKDHRSLIYTITYEHAGDLILHGKRVSYRVNEKGEKLYTRAEYLYSDYVITY